jgi:predicted ester cyclase
LARRCAAEVSVPAADAELKWELARVVAEGPLILARGSFRSDVLGQFGSLRDSGCTGKISSHEPIRDTGPLLQR